MTPDQNPSPEPESSEPYEVTLTVRLHVERCADSALTPSEAWLSARNAVTRAMEIAHARGRIVGVTIADIS